MKNKMNILFVGYHDLNHSNEAGYDYIARMPGTDYYNARYVPKQSTKGFIGNLMWHLKIEWMYLNGRFRSKKYGIVHYFYADTLLSPIKGSKDHKVVLTIHLDVRQRKRMPKNFERILKSADGVIVLSQEQRSILTGNFGINAKFIPHGFNKPKFKLKMPSENLPLRKFQHDKINIFLSGQQYRDVETAIKAIEFCNEYRSEIVFHILGAKSEFTTYLKSADNYIVYPRLSDDEYYTLLSLCDFNFLPVTFATANNTLLEGQSLGVTGILPKVPGIIDYGAPAPLNKYYNSNQELFQILASLEKQPSSIELITFAKRFEWSNIYRELREYYVDLQTD